MHYRINFSGGVRDGQKDTLLNKIGGYIRFTYADGSVEEYYRISDDDANGTYEYRSRTGGQNG